MDHVHPLEAYRTAKGLSQNDLAVELGVSRMAVWRWVSGARMIDLDLLPAISEKTGISARELRPDLAELMAPDTAPQSDETPAPAEASS